MQVLLLSRVQVYGTIGKSNSDVKKESSDSMRSKGKLFYCIPIRVSVILNVRDFFDRFVVPSANVTSYFARLSQGSRHGNTGSRLPGTAILCLDRDSGSRPFKQ